MSEARLSIFVCGLGRCGSSLVMQMLDRCGVPTLGEWPAYECEETIGLPGADAARWMREHAPGHAVKLLDPHRLTPPADVPALVIWLDRDVRQQAESQIKFGTILSGWPALSRVHRREFVANLERDRGRALSKLASLDHRRLIVRFETLVEAPHETAADIATFLKVHGGPAIDPSRAAAIVRPRAGTCFPGLLEMDLLSDGRPL